MAGRQRQDNDDGCSVLASSTPEGVGSQEQGAGGKEQEARIGRRREALLHKNEQQLFIAKQWRQSSSKQPEQSKVRPFPPSGDPVFRSPSPCLCSLLLPLEGAFNEAVALLFNCAWNG